jgi:hypothetical protein
MTKKLILSILCLCLAISTFAYDFAVANSDRITIYYKIESNKTVAVTYESYPQQSSDNYSGDLVIPSTVTYQGITYTVTGINNGAFQGCTNLTSIYIPETISDVSWSAIIDDYGFSFRALRAFYVSEQNEYFTAVDGVLFSKDKTELIAFPNLKSSSYTIPAGVKSIGNYAFCQRSNLISINIPSSVTMIGDGAFLSCINLSTIIMPENLFLYDVGWNAFVSTPWWINHPKGFVYAGHCLLGYRGDNGNWVENTVSLVVPEGTVSIATFAFAQYNAYVSLPFSSVTIPETMVNVGSGSFYDCSVDTLFFNAINCIDGGCRASKSVIIGNKVTRIPRIYTGDGDIATIILPNSVKVIDDNAFSDNNFTSISIPESVDTIGRCAFEDSKLLTSIVIKRGFIDEEAFANCDNLQTVIVENGTIANSAFELCDKLESVVIKNGNIGDNVFYGCDNLKSVVIEKGNIGRKAFSGSDNLQSVVIESGILGSDCFSFCPNLSSIVFGNGHIRIGGGAFGRCNSIESVVIPANVDSIGGGAFDICNSLKNVVIEDANVGVGAFSTCKKLETVTINSGCIENQSFVSCENLSTLNLCEGVSKIGDLSFCQTNIASVVIPKSVDSIGLMPFLHYDPNTYENIYILKKIEVFWDIPLASISDYAFYNVDTLIVPNGTKSLYQSARVWKDFGIILEKSETAIADLSRNSAVSINICDGNLDINSPYNETVSVYSLAGSLLYSKTKSTGKTEIPIDPINEKILIVTGSSGWRQKIITR